MKYLVVAYMKSSRKDDFLRFVNFFFIKKTLNLCGGFIKKVLKVYLCGIVNKIKESVIDL